MIALNNTKGSPRSVATFCCNISQAALLPGSGSETNFALTTGNDFSAPLSVDFRRRTTATLAGRMAALIT